MDKQTIRAEMRTRRREFVRSLDADRRARQQRDLAEAVFAQIPSEGFVASYCAVGDEIDPALISEALGERLALPFFASPEAIMTFRAADGVFEAGPFRIPQPARNAPQVEPDVLLVPLVAADLHRNRLGQGKGHYDRALSALSAQKPIRAIGLAWDVQIVDRLPADSWDVPLDLVVTPTRILR